METASGQLLERGESETSGVGRRGKKAMCLQERHTCSTKWCMTCRRENERLRISPKHRHDRDLPDLGFPESENFGCSGRGRPRSAIARSLSARHPGKISLLVEISPKAPLFEHI